MVRSSLLFAFAAAASSVLGFHYTGKQDVNTRIPGAYIVEFEDNHDPADFFSIAATEDAHTRMQFDYKLFKGASIQFHDTETAEERADRLASLPSVKQLWPVRLYRIPNPRIEWTGNPDQDYAVSKKRDINETMEDVFSPHVMTQVDKLRANGVTGKGIKVAVIDTGIDYSHPALGGCFGPGCLVSFGTDLAGDDYDGYNEPQPDKDPMDCEGHGTHVAGTIAAQQNPFGFTGAAPGVTLGAYRVFGCTGEASTEILIAAFNQAFEDGADIITASVGGPSGWSQEPWAVSVSRIVKQGVPCTVSAGNEGEEGLFYASTAANGKGVTTIASFDNTLSLALLTVSYYSINGSRQEFGYTPGNPAEWAGVNLPLWRPSPDASGLDEGCDPYPEGTPDLSGYVVLVKRGTCFFTQKAQNAADAGAKYIMVYNNDLGTGSIDLSEVEGLLAGGMVTQEQGEEWVALLEAGARITLQMLDPAKAEISLLQVENNITGGALSDYTTWGPTWEMDVKPQFGVPGGSILSTYPTALGGYAVLSGTSMACPLAAAIIALIAEVRGTLDPTFIEDLMSASSNPQLFNDGAGFYEFIAPVPQQGGGMVQAYDAAYATTLLHPSSLSFNDTANFVEVLNFTLYNTGHKSITYEISHVPAITMYTLVDGSIYADFFPNEPTTEHASLRFSEDKLTLAPGEKVAIEVLPTPPKGLNAERLPLWSGYIAVNGSDGSSYSLPYQGLTGSLHDHIVLAPEDVLVYKSGDENMEPVPANATFTLPLPGVGNASDHVLPAFAWFLALGSAKLYADIVPVSPINWTWPHPYPVNDTSNDGGSGGCTSTKCCGTTKCCKSAKCCDSTKCCTSTKCAPKPCPIKCPSPPCSSNSTTGGSDGPGEYDGPGAPGRPGNYSIGQLEEFPVLWNPRGLGEFWDWTGLMEGGAYAPPGIYKLVFRALRIFGDESNEDDWDVSETTPFAITYGEP